MLDITGPDDTPPDMPHTTNGMIRDELVENGNERHQVLEQDLLEPIAVIGYSLRFPQDASSSAAFWQMLVDGVCTSGDIPKDRFNLESFYHEDPSRVGTVRFPSPIVEFQPQLVIRILDVCQTRSLSQGRYCNLRCAVLLNHPCGSQLYGSAAAFAPRNDVQSP